MLIVDDDKGIRMLISQIAQSWGYETVDCDSAESAIAVLSKSKFNIVLTDIKMGKMDGIEFAEKIRNKMPSVAVIIMTGNPTTKTARQSQEMGAIYYMQKPMNMDDLGNTLSIAAAWNIGMLTDSAARRFLALKNENDRAPMARTQSIKTHIKKLIGGIGWMEHLRDFVYGRDIEKNPLYVELKNYLS
ncbi:MAG TPA: response regulator [Turneriella sp.]|nr:response regulator [Turneriella sp.]